MKSDNTQNRKPLLVPALLTLLLAVVVFLYHYIDSNRGVVSTSEHQDVWVAYLSASAGPSAPSALPNLPESLPGASQIALGQKIDLNKASAADLEALPGIGQKMAEMIVQDRQTRGPFRKPEDLMRVQGIKDKKFSQIKAYIMVEKKK